MPYHYEVSIRYMVPDGPDDFTVEEDVREFGGMQDAIRYAQANKRDGAKVYLVFKDVPDGQLEDRCELPLKLV